MIKAHWISVALVVVLGSSVLISEARLANNARRAVVLEAFHALRPSADGSCYNTINGNCVSTWNYLNNDFNAYSTMKNLYNPWPDACLASVWIRPGDGSDCTTMPYQAPVSFYNNVATYGYAPWYLVGSNYTFSIGRGGQCKYFANLILYRSGTYPQMFPNYDTMWSKSTNDFSNVREGDVVFTVAKYSGAKFDHTAIVVEIKRSGGTITGIDVIDSNFLSDNGDNQGHREVIGRHYFDINYLRQVYRIWKETPYYNCRYDPSGVNTLCP